MPVRARRFGAFVEPAGVMLVEYRKSRAGVRMVDVRAAARPLAGIREAADCLGELVHEMGAERALLAVALRGFGSAYLNITLPQSTEDVLRPIVHREVRRSSPDLDDPVFTFTDASALERRRLPRPDTGVASAHLLVSAVPSGLVAELRDRLFERGVELEFLTVAPHVLQQLYHELDGSQEPTCVVLALPGGPLIGFFLDGQLRLTVETPPDAVASVHSDAQMVLERVERGSLYLRLQFRGARPSRFLVSASSTLLGQLEKGLPALGEVPILPFGAGLGEPSALVGLGAALDTVRGGGENNLLPHVPSLADRVREGFRRAGAGAATLCVAGLLLSLWAGAQIAAVAHTRAHIIQLNEQLERPDPMLPIMRSSLEQRRTAAVGLASLNQAIGEHMDLQERLRALARTVAPNVQLDELALRLQADGWHADVKGRTVGRTGAEAVRALDSFYRGVPAQVGTGNLTLDALDYFADTAHAGVLVQFRVSFVAPTRRLAQ